MMYNYSDKLEYKLLFNYDNYWHLIYLISLMIELFLS